MSSKIRFFVILMFFCLVSLNTINAYDAYLKLYILDLDTNSAEIDPILLVDHANSPIQWKVTGAGCAPTIFTNDIAVGEYGDGDTIITGSEATFTPTSSCTFYLQVDEVKVGSYYYGSCATDTTSSLCTTCAGGGASCQVHGESTQASEYYGAPTNGYLFSYLFSYWQTHATIATAANCNVDSDFGDCSDEIQDTIYGAQTTEFNISFIA